MSTNHAWLKRVGAIVVAVAVAGCLGPGDGAGDPFVRLNEAHAALATPKDAEAAGWVRATGYVPHMGLHYYLPERAEAPFDADRPNALNFVRDADGTLRLGALEYWVPRATNIPPEGFAGDADTWGTHEASCHFVDGTQVQGTTRESCPEASASTGSPLAFWHPNYWTLHVWLYEDNPEGRFVPFNPRVP